MARIIDESFEGTGYEETWTETVDAGNTLDEDCPIPEDVSGSLPLGSGTECLKAVIPAGASSYLSIAKRDYGSSVTTCFVRNYIKVDSEDLSDGNYKNILLCLDSSSTNVFIVRIIKSGTNLNLEYRYYSGGTMLTDSVVHTITLNTWYRVEVKYDTVGMTWQWWVDGVSKNSGSLSVAVKVPRHFWIGLIGTDAFHGEVYHDLFAVDDASLIGEESDFSFSKMILRPSGDVNAFWSRSGGTTNYENVDEAVANDDTDYIYIKAPESSVYDHYSIEAPSGILGKILNVRLWARCKTEGTWRGDCGREVRFRIRTHSTTYSSGYMILTDEYLNYFFDNYINPNTGKPWTWDEIETLIIGINSLIGIADSGWGYGGRVTQMYAEIFHGSPVYRLLGCGPVFGGVTSSQIKVFTKLMRPALVGDGVGYVKIRYSENSDLSGYSETASQQLTSSSDWTHIFTISSLDADKTYYFDIMVSGDDSTWTSTHDDFGWSAYPSCKTFPTEHQFSEFDFLFMCDQHKPGGDRISQYFPATSRFAIMAGDIGYGQSPGDLAKYRIGALDIYNFCIGLKENVYNKMPIEMVWDDHDFGQNNADKTIVNKENALQAFKEYHAMHNPPSENADFQYGLWRNFIYGNAEFFILDTRYRRDPNETINGDMLDGTEDGGGSGAGHDQRDWLIEQINNSPSKWKFIITSVPFITGTTIPGTGGDSWGSYDPNNALRNYLIANIKADNVILLSGDFHSAGIDNGTNSHWPELLASSLDCGNRNLVGQGTWSEFLVGKGTDTWRNYFGFVQVRNNYVDLNVYDELNNLVGTFRVPQAIIRSQSSEKIPYKLPHTQIHGAKFNGGYINIGTDETLKPSTFTLEVLINVKDITSVQTIVALKRNSTTKKGIILRIASTSKFEVGVSDGVDTAWAGAGNVIKTSIYHLAATFDGANILLYVDGELYGSPDTLSGSIVYDDTVANNIGAGSSGANLLNAHIFKVRLYNGQVLTQAQIKENIRGNVLRNNNLVLEHDYSSGYTRDLSGYGNHGVISGNVLFI